MNLLPQNLTTVTKIYFIAEDATGPFRRVVQLVLLSGNILSFEEKHECAQLIRWLYDQNIMLATKLENLLNEKDEHHLEILVFKNENL